MFIIPPLTSDILAMSLDGKSSPSISINLPKKAGGSHSHGWGFGWYPDDDSSATVTKDPAARGEQVLVDAITDWANFRSTTFFCKVRGASKGYSHTQTQPFSRSFAGRDWLFLHNGDLDKESLESLQSKKTRLLEPLGNTDSELAFCELLAQLWECGARRIADVDPHTLHRWFGRFDHLGSADMFLSDGSSIVCFHGTQSPKQMYHTRIQPPNNHDVHTSEAAKISLSDPRDTYRTALIVSSSPFTGGQDTQKWMQVPPGQMIIIRRGVIIFDSAPGQHQPVKATPGSTPTTQQPVTFMAQSQAEQAQTDPIQAKQAQSEQSQSEQSQSEQSQSEQPQSEQSQSEQSQSEQSQSEQPQSEQSQSEQPQTEQSQTEQSQTEQSQTEQSQTEQSQTKQTQTEQTHRKQALGLELNVRAMTQTAEGKPLNYRLFEVVHSTNYGYAKAVEHSTHTFRLQPTDDPIQEVVTSKLSISSRAEEILYEDVFGNQAIYCIIDQPYTQLTVEATSRVKIFAAPPDDHSLSRRQTSIPLVWMPWQRQMMMPYLLPMELPESQLTELTEYAMSFVARNDLHLLKTIEDMNISIYRDYKYVSGSTALNTTPFEIYTSRQGVCQDFANLFICLARLLGIPARYRMGYIYTGANYTNKIQSDASHAWAEVYLPYVGWRGFDPTNGCAVAQDHIRVACGRNYIDATPTSGTIYKGGGTETLTIDVKMHEITDELT